MANNVYLSLRLVQHTWFFFLLMPAIPDGGKFQIAERETGGTFYSEVGEGHIVRSQILLLTCAAVTVFTDPIVTLT